MSLISPTTKLYLKNQLNKVVETFEIDLVFFEDAGYLNLSSAEDFMHVFGRPQANSSSNKTPNSSTIKARVFFLSGQDTEPSNFTRTDNIRLAISASKVRIKLRAEDYEGFKDAKIIKVYGSDFSVDSEPRKHGLFSDDFVTLILTRAE